MSLTGRLTMAMVVLVVLTAAAVGWLSFRLVDDAILPRELEQLEIRLHRQADGLANGTAAVRRDIIGFRAAVALDGIVRATRAGGVSPGDNVSLDTWRGRMARRLAVELETKPNYAQFRIIGIRDGGREVVRVDRSGPGGAVRIVPDAELRRKGDRDYMIRTLALPEGEIHVSRVDLNQEDGKIETPHVPTLRVAMPVRHADGSLFGIVIINQDLRPNFESLRRAPHAGRIFVVNEEGDYLMHPDRAHEFGFQLGQRYRIQDDFPEAGQVMRENDPRPRTVPGPDGEPTVLVTDSRRLAEGPRVTVVEAVQLAALTTSIDPVRKAALLAGVAAVLVAVGLAVLIARTLTRPITQMTRSVESLTKGKPFEVPKGARGEVAVLAQAFATTTRELREQNEKTRHNAEIFETIMGNLGDPVMLLDGQGRWIYANAAAYQIYGDLTKLGPYAERVPIPITRPDGTPFPYDERPAVRLLRGETVDGTDLVLVDRTGTPRQFLVSGRPIKDAAGKVRAAVVLQHEVTAVREVERRLQQAQRLEAVGQLTGGVAHDFNNILTVIFGALEFIAEDVYDKPELVKLTDMINMAARRGADLIAQLLAFSRRQPLAPEETDLNALVVEATGLLRQTLGENIEISLSLEASAWHAIIDPSQLTTGLLNLALNARDAMPNGGKLIIETGNVTLDETYAQANPEAAPGDYVRVAVSDSGAGIPQELLGRVLEPFFTTKPVGRGTGLGLSMVYGFVRQSGGHLQIYSEVGQGTTICLYLPRFSAAGTEAGKRTEEGELPRGHETILVVEDDQQVRELAVGQVKSLGYVVHAAESGPDALALADQGLAFDLLFTDVVMPGGMNGRELAREMARRRPGLRVLFTSGYTENAIVHHGRLEPGVALLPKPYRRVVLAQKLREALDGPPTPV